MLRTTYMLALPERRALRAQWQGPRALLLTGADVGALTEQVELALFFDAKLDVAAMA